MKAEGRKNKDFLPAWLALGTSLLLFLSFPGAVGFWPLAWVCLVPLMLALRDVKPWQGARLGLLAGMIHYVSLLYWIVIVLGRYGKLPIWVSIPALFLLAFYMSCYLALFCGLFSRIWKQNDILATWSAPFLWVGLDYLRSFLFSGFPWQDLAYSQYSIPLLIQTADITGHYGITFQIIITNSALALLASLRKGKDLKGVPAGSQVQSEWRQIRNFVIVPVLLLATSSLVYNLLRMDNLSRVIQASPKMKIGIVQGNIDQDQKWSPALRFETIDKYINLSDKALQQGEESAELIVWPETALPFLLNENLYFKALKKKLARRENVWVLSGAPYFAKIATGNDQQKGKGYISYNSAYLLKPKGEIGGRYDKQHLVPFGEYVPLSDILPLPGPLVENIGNFSSGRPVGPLSCQGAKIGVLICFESIFPQLARNWTVSGANLLVNITNDAWFGRSSAPWQHLSMTVFRAVENRRGLVRSANTGISTFIDPLGRMTETSPLFEPYSRVEEVPLLQEKTIFASIGHNFGLLCLLACLPILLILNRKNRARYDADIKR